MVVYCSTDVLRDSVYVDDLWWAIHIFWFSIDNLCQYARCGNADVWFVPQLKTGKAPNIWVNTALYLISNSMYSSHMVYPTREFISVSCYRYAWCVLLTCVSLFFYSYSGQFDTIVCWSCSSWNKIKGEDTIVMIEHFWLHKKYFSDCILYLYLFLNSHWVFICSYDIQFSNKIKYFSVSILLTFLGRGGTFVSNLSIFPVIT